MPDRIDSRRASKNLVHGFDEDEFEAFNEVHDDSNDEDGRIDNSVPSDNPLSVEDETNDGTGKFCVRSHMFACLLLLLRQFLF